MNELKQPSEYMDAWRKSRDGKPKNYPMPNLRVERKTNRHPDEYRNPWGWYEVFPLGITVGFWGAGKNDLRGVDIAEWNNRAKALCEGVE